jgi:ribonuclease E
MDTEAGSESSEPIDNINGNVGGPNQQGPNQQGPNQEQGPGEGGGRRRRRRRGRRGRGRGRQFAEGQQQPDAQGQPGEFADTGSEPGNEESRHEDFRQEDFGPQESFVEEDVIEATLDGKITSETVETSAYFHDRQPEPEMEIDRPIAVEPPAPVIKESAPVAEDESPARKSKAKPRSSRGGRAKTATTRKKAASKATESAAKPAVESAAVAEAPVVVKTGSTDRHLIEDEPAFPQPVRRPKSVRDLDHIPDDFD